MDLDLSDRVYIVTQGADGLGLAAAECLVAEGARVVLSGPSDDTLEAAVIDLGQSAAVSVPTDGDDAGTPDRLVAAALATWGRVDGALICVDDSPSGRASDVTDEEWTSAFESVFLGTVRLCRHIAQTLPSGGSLALVLSSSVHEPVPEGAVANGLQRGLASLALQLSEELGPHGVRVNGLLPGHLAASTTEVSGATATDAGPDRSALLDTDPTRRYGEPEEFGRVAAFVLSPAASYITGSMIPIDGGMQRSL